MLLLVGGEAKAGCQRMLPDMWTYTHLFLIAIRAGCVRLAMPRDGDRFPRLRLELKLAVDARNLPPREDVLYLAQLGEGVPVDAIARRLKRQMITQ